MNATNTLYHRPLYPRMGVQHIRKEFIQVQTTSTNEQSTTVVKNLKKNHLFINDDEQHHEKLKLQEKIKLRKNGGHILLNTIMPTTRKPIKAKHRLLDENITELITDMRNEHNPCNHHSTINDVSCLRTTNCEVIESKNFVCTRPVTSSPTDSCSCQIQKNHHPNSNIQRRLSEDCVSLTKSLGITELNWNNDKPTPAKRKNIENVCLPSTLDLRNHNDQLSVHSLNQIPISDNTTSTCTSNTNSCLLSPFTTNLKKQNVPSKKQGRWSIDITKRSTRRSSTGSLKMKQLDIEQDENIDPNIGDTMPESKLGRSDIFKEIRRSARRTLSSLYNVLRYSNSNLTTVINNSNIHDHQLDTNPVECNERSTDSSSSILPVEFNDPVKESISNNVHSQDNDEICLRYVTLSRPDLDEPFGLFVIKSEQGYRITRLSEHFIQNNPTDEICIGDEIIQVNHIDSIQFTINELQELFQKSQTLQLTIIHR
ncbi:unnamed protein product [Schistosoma turkestanicum]|nr:unnamed protein product [Schistosoma turkestanicum]